jgi:predicted ATPase
LLAGAERDSLIAMITRFYADNFKCLANVTLEFEPYTVLVGPNGSGKSSVLEALRKITDLVAQRGATETLFPTESLTRWDRRSEQLFELDIRLPMEGQGEEVLPEGVYHYTLRLSHDRLREKNRIAEEKLIFESKTLYRGWLDTSQAAENGGVPSFRAELFKDNGVKGSEVLMDWRLSGISRIAPRTENRLLQRFRRFIAHVVVLSINPASVTAEARREESMVSFNGSDFAAWFLYLHNNQALACREAERKLRENVLPELALFQMESDGSMQVAKAIYQSSGKDDVRLRLDELSAGQRTLVILEHALAVTKAWRSSVIIDEPANFLGLSEIEPLLVRMQNNADEGQAQSILTSHHPVAYDLIAERAGLWLERTPLGSTQVKRVCTVIESLKDTAIPLSELVARGWVSRDAPLSDSLDVTVMAKQ